MDHEAVCTGFFEMKISEFKGVSFNARIDQSFFLKFLKMPMPGGGA